MTAIGLPIGLASLGGYAFWKRILIHMAGATNELLAARFHAST
jgi:hypothetical protein